MKAIKEGKQPDFRGNPNDPPEEEKKEESKDFLGDQQM